jgi:hypothetical protein
MITPMPIRCSGILTVLAAALLALAPAAADAKAPPQRVGGKVHRAWPANGKGKPRNPFARFLARQVGPVTPPEVKKAKKKRKAKKSKFAVAHTAAATPTALALVRSFDIPTNDPSYSRLLNTSFTYDSAVAAASFVNLGYKTQAEQLLDQLAALQRTDGSIDYAFNVYSGSTDAHLRTGTIAWAGLAATTYGKTYGATKYGAFATKIATWLTSQQRPDGLLKGGPDVSWVSTQNNLLAYFFFRAEASVSTGNTAKAYDATADKIATGIDASLLKTVGSTMYFQQGLDDTVHPLDAQALGVLYLINRNQAPNAGKVADYINNSFTLTNRSIVKSTVPATYNNTYAAAGPFIGYRPYADDGAPDVLWMEGTLEARFAQSLLKRSTTNLDNSISSWYGITSSDAAGPLMADKTVTGNRFNEYHVWPVSAAASWAMINLAQSSQKTFVLP